MRVMLTAANARVRGKPERAGIVDLIGRTNVFPTLPDAPQAIAAQPADRSSL